MKFARRILACARILIAALLLISPAGIARQTRNAPAQNARPAAIEPREFTVTVTDKQGNLVRGLPREAFSVFDGKEQREIVAFSDADTPATVGVLLDASGSMRGDRGRDTLVRIRNGLLRFFRGCHKSDEFFMIAFNKSPQLLLDMSNDPAAMLSAIDRFAAREPKGPTALYDALYLALNRAARSKHTKRALVVITDGEDNISKYTFREVERALKESDVILYAVTILDESGDSQLGYVGRESLHELTSVSGGAAFYAGDEKKINSVMIQIAAELRDRYSVAFIPAPGAAKDGWHEVKFKLGELRDAQGKKVKPVVRARPGFYDAHAAPR